MKKKIIILLILLIIIIPVAYIFFDKVVPRYTNPYSIFTKPKKVGLIVGTKDETERIVNDILIEDDKILFSYEDMNRFIDAYIIKDEKNNKIITNSKTHTKVIDLDTKKMREYLSTDSEGIYIENIDGKLYFDIKELADVYNIDVEYVKDTNLVTIKKDIHTYKIGTISIDKTKMMKLPSKISVKLAKLNQGEQVYILQKDKEYYKVLDNKGRFGYVLQSNVENISDVNKYVENIDDRKISLIWEYAENYTPDRTGQTKIDCINVIAPTWFTLQDDTGKFSNSIDYSYIKWADSVGYEIWPSVSNGRVIITTSTVLNDCTIREKMVSELLQTWKKYGFKGINLDFEYIYKNDKDAYSQFVRELSVAFRNNGISVSVDVTVPDGSDNYSLCYDRKALGEAANYVVLMAYDQTSQYTKEPGSNAANNWVELNVEKLLQEVDNKKLIVAIPLYTRLWSIKPDGEVKSQALTISESLNKVRENRATVTYLENEKQDYTEYYLGNTKYVMWIEDLKSIEEKLKLYKSNDLAGVAFWRKGYEPVGLWDLVEKYILSNNQE